MSIIRKKCRLLTNNQEIMYIPLVRYDRDFTLKVFWGYTELYSDI